MGAKDLMIDDWVYLVKDYGKVKKDILKLDILELHRVSDGMLEVKPILLTPEILEKNGFEIISKGVYVYYNSAADGYIKIRLCDLLDGEWELYVDNYEKFDDSHYTFTIDRCFLKVHQLQHALRLCEIEKEIIL